MLIIVIMKSRKPELLSPIQDYTSLTAAIDNGADAVFFGIKGFNMRAGAKNFGVEDLPKIVKIAHNKNVKVYLAINTIIYEEELGQISKILKKVREAKVDAIICWDLAVVEIAQKLGLEIHLSTQASVANSASAKFYKKLGIKRIVLARECSLEQIREIKKTVGMEVEVFIHGAMCVSISGRCFMSQYLYGKSANRGECRQPCRKKYLIKEVEEGKELELGENYVLSPNDLCTIDFIEKILDTGADCLKIEGRNRSPEYVATVTRAYRTIIDFIWTEKGKAWGKAGAKQENKEYLKKLAALKQKLNKDLEKVYHRGKSSGFYLGKPINEWTKTDGNEAAQTKAFVGKVWTYYPKIGVAEIIIQAVPKIQNGDTLIFQGPTTGNREEKITSMEKNHKKIKSAGQGEKVAIKLSGPVRRNDEVYLVEQLKA